MKLDLAHRPTKTVICILAVTALAINWCFWNRNHSQSSYAFTGKASAANESQKAEFTAKEEHDKYVAHYINAEIKRGRDSKLVPILVVTEDGTIDRTLTHALSQHVKSDGVSPVESYFKPEVLSDGLFTGLFYESNQMRQNLDLDKSVDGLIFGKLSVDYSSNPTLQNVITARVSLEVVVQATQSHEAGTATTLNVSGAGFDEKAARIAAIERLLIEIEKDKKISLNPILAPNHHE